ncbi:aspartate--tRNA ligase dps1 [Irineochytrium annulatum]|nr:aspartate--tRNA ligase dps1 [Irineochytrium annulatum]
MDDPNASPAWTGPKSAILGKDGRPLSSKELEKLKAAQEKDAEKAAEMAAREASDNDSSVECYGTLPVNQSQKRTGKCRVLVKLHEISSAHVGQTVLVMARVQRSHSTGKLGFLALRQRISTIQAVLVKTNVSKQMFKYVLAIPKESIVLVEAIIAALLEPVRSCTVHDFELRLAKVYVSSQAERVPFSIEDASRPEVDFEKDPALLRVRTDTRLDHRVLDLRTTTSQAIIRMQSGVCQLFREFLEMNGFIEIHSPKIVAAASEGGASVFKLTYFQSECVRTSFVCRRSEPPALIAFKEEAFLAQSPQFYKQMAICADMERVYEIAPVFRAHMASTHRHLTEYVSLDLEMAFEEHYHEVLEVFDRLFVFLFDGLRDRFAAEIAAVKRQYPFEGFLYLPKTPTINHKEGVEMLRGAGFETGDFDDMGIVQERILGKLVREKYKTDFYFIDKFPLGVRPFYTMPDPLMPGYSNSYDFFMRGDEILSGAQRIHDPNLLEMSAKDHGIDPKTIRPYLYAFKYGVPPHAGGAIGLERLVMLYCNLGNVRRAALFPRDSQRLEP